MKRNHQIVIKLSLEELQKLKQKAELLGMTISAYLRFISLSAKIDIHTE